MNPPILNIKVLTTIIFLTSMMCCSAQVNDPFFEQNAFDFYRTEILQKSPIKKRLKITKDLNSIHHLSGDCLRNKIYNEENVNSYPNSKYYKGYRLDLKKIDKRQFRAVKKINKFSNSEKFIEVSIAQEFKGRIFVVIQEFIEGRGKIYTFEFDKNGNIIDWCISSKYEQILIE